MKTFLIIALCLTMLFSFAACGSAETEITTDAETENANLVNPCSDSSAEAAAEALGLAEISFSDEVTVNSVTKIDTEPVIYSFDLTRDGTDYTLRLAIAEDGTEDISGVYLSGDISSAEYCSASEEEGPSVSASADSENAVATGTWKGLLFSVSAEALSVDDIYNACSTLLKDAIGD